MKFIKIKNKLINTNNCVTIEITNYVNLNGGTKHIRESLIIQTIKEELQFYLKDIKDVEYNQLSYNEKQYKAINVIEFISRFQATDREVLDITDFIK